eukprot:15364542-Ditylum_brightwellii.AAC.2
MFLHTKRYWPGYVTTVFWPYVLKATEAHCNKYDIDDDGVSPEEKFANIRTVQNLMDKHTWGCPVYTLNACLQDCSSSIPKWDPSGNGATIMGQPYYNCIASSRQPCIWYMGVT